MRSNSPRFPPTWSKRSTRKHKRAPTPIPWLVAQPSTKRKKKTHEADEHLHDEEDREDSEHEESERAHEDAEDEADREHQEAIDASESELHAEAGIRDGTNTRIRA